MEMMIVVNVTLSIPEALYKKMKKHPELNWSEIARQSIRKRIRDLEILDQIVAKSKMTMEDALEIGEMVKKSSWKKMKSEIS